VLRLLFDEDLNLHIVRGLVRRLPGLDYATALSLGLRGQSDDAIVRAAADGRRLLVSHDVNTMTAAFRRVLSAGGTSCGLLLVPQDLPIGRAIDDLELICTATSIEDWLGTLEFLPL
jgi:hypothetical protein